LILLASVSAGSCTKEDEAAEPPQASTQAVQVAPKPAAPPPPAPPKEPDEFAEVRARQAAEGGAVNYKKFSAVLVDKLGPFKAANPLEGVNEAVAPGVVLTTGIRQYRAGERLLIITIADAFVHRVAARLKGEPPAQGEPELGAIRTATIGEYPAVFGWIEDLHESLAHVLVGERVVDLRIVGATRPDDAEKVARLLKFDVLRKLTPDPH
jgi:hypothetical protein